ncbi:conjugal transfer protein TraI [Arcticibacter tournemirensis]|uniref:Conjugal transfer protein TraI n=1 Tax=Arcticibacter tournemirensis TaxID=699437 RepID=A0A5M9H247_9SPHI|nr:conjugal transfer protein TraI [Arcticibacter tournemirensis]KAA8480081.1 conjugal transfer protein TraI [Arcticibacter tournemirensis]
MKLISSMKKYMVMLPVSAMTLFVALPVKASAQIAVAEVIKAGVKKVIKAVDLKVQRLQNETIWLQNTQKVLENQLSKLKLAEIADWSERQRELYSKYFNELWEIKTAITYYRRIKDLTEKQVAIVDEYRWAWNLFTRDKHFTPEELSFMESVYKGILDASIKNVDQILLVVNSFKTQMTDAKRLEIINTAAAQIDENYTDLKKFNTENSLLSIQRAQSADEVTVLRELYGIEQ